MSKVFGHAVNGYGKSIGGVWSEEAMKFAIASKADTVWDEDKAQRAKIEFAFNGVKDGIEKSAKHMACFGKIWLGGPDAYKNFGILK